MIGHLIEKETELSKPGEEFKHVAHFLGGYLAISHLLHAIIFIALFNALALGHFAPSGLHQ